MPPDPSTARRYWRANLRLIAILLAIWAGVAYGLGYLLALPLNGITVGRVPLPFWVVQQGAIIVFVLLIFVYARAMDRIDAKFDLAEETEESPQ